ncbi:MAG: hypothetical protein H0W84_10900 [Bacteroidetes bacterium]|nr:hypothetical protein [Bacteroidota bacterium]
MKKILLLLVTPMILFFAGCGQSKTDETVESMPGMMEVTLKINGNILTVMVPDSTKGKMEMVDQSWGATEIKVGKEFQISIAEGEGDIVLMKSDIAGNDVNKFTRFVKDEPTLVFWESQITEPEFHFYTVVKAGTVSYVIEDIKGEIFNEKAAQAMIDASKTLKAKEAAKPNA